MTIAFSGCDSKDKNLANSFDGVKISYDIAGAGDAAIVFVHGWSCNKSFWKHQVPYFAKRYKVVTIDLAGHGASGKSRKDYTIESFGKDVKAVADKLNLNNMILVGHSMGGTVMADAARQMPGRVLCVVGADTFHDIAIGYDRTEVDKIVIKLKSNFSQEVQHFVRPMFTPKTDPKLVDWVLGKMSLVDPAIAINAFTNLGAYDLKTAASQIKAPIYSINADFWPTNFEMNKQCVPSYKLKLMKGLGHFVMLEDSAGFNKFLDEIIAGLK